MVLQKDPKSPDSSRRRRRQQRAETPHQQQSERDNNALRTSKLQGELHDQKRTQTHFHGYSGANFNRPGFERMMADVEDGGIAVIITKNLSRLGRHQLHTGLYIEEIFPSYDVRYIAINDNVGTLYETGSELMPFKNLFNEWHVRDCSRKVRAVFNAKAQRGERIGTRAPYGYRKSEVKGGPLEVDEEAARVVKRIFAMCAGGLGPSQIARQLREEKVLSPSMYAYTKCGISHSGLNTGRPYNWTGDMISDMLMNMAYLGHTVNMRYSTGSYKDKKRRERPRSERTAQPSALPTISARSRSGTPCWRLSAERRSSQGTIRKGLRNTFSRGSPEKWRKRSGSWS